MRRSLILPLFLALATGLAPGCAKRAPESPAGDVRIVSLAPNITEIVCALGARNKLVGRTSACNFPPDLVGGVPVIGGFGAPSLEMLLAATPTLILEVDLADETLGHKIDNLGVRRERVACGNLDEISEAVAAIGTLIGEEKRGQELVDELAVGIAKARLRARAVTNRPAVLVEVWGDPITTAGRGSFVSELVELAGGRNIGDEVNKPYYQVSPEWVVSRDPEVIVCLYMAHSAPVRETVMRRSGWASVSAVRTGRVHDGLNNDRLLRPGPRVLEGAEELRRRIQEGE